MILANTINHTCNNCSDEKPVNGYLEYSDDDGRQAWPRCPKCYLLTMDASDVYDMTLSVDVNIKRLK
jgi:hypothetical protein